MAAKRDSSTSAKRASVLPKSGASRTRSYYRNPENWPDFDTTILSRDDKLRVKELKNASYLHYQGQPMSRVAARLTIGSRQFQYLYNKAISVKPDGSGIWGVEAFVRWRSQSERVRTKDLKADLTIEGGLTGIFGALLREHPSIEDGLVEFLLGRQRPNDTAIHVIHREFKRLCRSVGLGEEDYPFVTQTEGRYALIDWFKLKFFPRHFDAYVAAEYGQDAATAIGHTHGDGQANTPGGQFTDWVLDETPLDLHARVELPSLLGDTDHHPVARACVVRCISMNPTVNLSWRLVLARQAAGPDIAMLLYDAMAGQTPAMATVPDCVRMPGADWAARAFSQLRWCPPTRVYLDNALSHLFDSVQNMVTDLWGGEVKLGIPKDPKERARVEAAFSKQSRRVTSQLPSTAGTHPRDPRKKKSEVPVKSRVSLLDLEHVLDTYIVNENATPAESSMYRTPIARLGSLLEAKLIDMEPLDSARRFAHWFCDPQNRRIHSNLSDGRAPYVNYQYCRYTSDAMKKLPNMAGVLRIRADLRNLQTVHAWSEDGAYFGVLYAEGQFGKVPNDIRIRKLFGHYKAIAAFSERADDTPMQALFQHLKNGAPMNPSMALQLSYVTHYLAQHVGPEMLEEWGQTGTIVGKPGAANEDGTSQADDAPCAPPKPPSNAPPAAALGLAEPRIVPAPPNLVTDNGALVRVAVPRRLRN